LLKKQILCFLSVCHEFPVEWATLVVKRVEHSLRVWKVRDSNSQSGQVKDWKIGTCCFHGQWL